MADKIVDEREMRKIRRDQIREENQQRVQDDDRKKPMAEALAILQRQRDLYAGIVLLEEKIVSNGMINLQDMWAKDFIYLALACKTSSFEIEGLIVATFTPMTKDGEVDYDRIPSYCDYLVKNNLLQIYVNGTTGEGFSLTLDERKKIIDKWMTVGRKTGKLKSLIVHVGALNLHDSQDLARHAASVGADAIATVPPLFFKPKRLEHLIKYGKEVASAAPDLPFFFYHIPQATGVEMNIEDLLREGTKEIPSLVGAKFSSKDLVDLIGCVFLEAPNKNNKKFELLYGCDEKLMAALVMGARCGVGSTYQIRPRMVHRILQNTTEGKIPEARLDQWRLQQWCRVMYRYGDLLGNNVASLKAFMSLAGLDLGPSRSPLRGPTTEELGKLKNELEVMGFFGW